MFRNNRNNNNQKGEEGITKITKCKYCQASVTWVEIPGSLNTFGGPKRLPYLINDQGQNSGVVHKCSIGLAEWEERRREQEEKDRQAGRSKTMPCSRCSKPIYWSYQRLSRNKKPLPIDEGTDEMHMCAYWKGK